MDVAFPLILTFSLGEKEQPLAIIVKFAPLRAEGRRGSAENQWELSPRTLFEVVNDNFFHEGFYALGDEFEVLGMDLVIVLGLLAGENRVQRDLIGLVHDGALAADHLADVEMREAGDGLEEFMGAGDDGIGGLGFGGVGPENDDVTETGANICYIWFHI